MKIGFHASHEQWPPSALLAHIRRAEYAGFAVAMCSDHFHPWLDEQGQSGFAWSWLGAALEATNLSFGTVCAPGQRYHPAIIAQAAATLAEMFPGRFWIAVGSGEALNEHITGETWPAKSERNARLKECVDVVRALWNGEVVNHHGRIHVSDAKLYTRAGRPPLIIGAALSEETARWMGGWADGLITAGHEAKQLKRILDAFREGGGEAKPAMLQAAVSFAATDEEAVDAAHRQWRQCVLDGRQLVDLATPWAFEAATRDATLGEVRRRFRVSADLNRHIDWLRSDEELGFDAVYIHQVCSDVERFLESFAAEVLPQFHVL